jgi:anhydro-N-acetylmuramic acid kinase
VVNIGGVANVTWIGRDGSLLAFDTGPGNALLDELAGRHTPEAMDRDGRLAARGTVDETALQAFLTHPYFAQKPPKSIDRNEFSLFLVEGMDVPDAAATLTAITAEAVALSARHMPRPPNRWIISGGGARNLALMAALKSRLQGRVDPARALGWSVEFMEAEAFAYLAVRSLLQLPLTFPGTTGVTEPLGGGVLVRSPGGKAGEAALSRSGKA